MNEFSTQIIQRDLFFEVPSIFLNDEKQTNAEMAALGQEMQTHDENYEYNVLMPLN